MSITGNSRAIEATSGLPYINIKANTCAGFPANFIQAKHTGHLVSKEGLINVNKVHQMPGDTRSDSTLIDCALQLVSLLVDSGPFPFSKHNIEVQYLGDTSFKPTVTTTLLFVNLRGSEDYEHQLILGLNLVNKRLISVIKFSEKKGYPGFSNLTYTKLTGDLFKIIYALPGDITGKIDSDQLISRDVKLRANGKAH